MQTHRMNITSKDGAKIPAITTFSAASAPPKGVVIICHGFGEHSGSYGELMERLLEASCASIAFDQRGHGALGEASPEKRRKKLGVIPGYESFLDDIDAVIAAAKQMAPNVPLALYGHSMGGNIAANYLLRRGQEAFACAVLESPWLGLYNDLNPLAAAAAKLFGSLSPKLAITTKLKRSDITGDAAKAEAIDADPLYHNRISFRLVTGIRSGCAYALNNAARLSLPAFLAFAKGERIVSNPAIAAFYGACGDNVTTKEYDSRHAIHNDAPREEFYRDAIVFLDKFV